MIWTIQTTQQENLVHLLGRTFNYMYVRELWHLKVKLVVGKGEVYCEKCHRIEVQYM